MILALAYEAIKKTAMQARDGMDYVQKLQYIPADTMLETVGNALEYAIDDWCMAQMAKALHKDDDFIYFSKRANLYQLYFDKEPSFMRGKLANGNWRSPFNPLSSAHSKRRLCRRKCLAVHLASAARSIRINRFVWRRKIDF